MLLDAFAEQSLELFAISLFTEVTVAVIRKGQVPVTPDFQSIAIASEAATRWQRTDSVKHCLRRRHVFQRQIIVQGFYIQPCLYSRMLQNRFNLRGKG